MRLIRIWGYDGILTSTIVGIVDTLAVANALWASQHREEEGSTQPLFSWRVESPDGRPIKAATGLILPVDGKIGGRGRSDAVVVVGTFVGKGLASFNDHLDSLLPRLQLLVAALHREHGGGALVASVCSGAFLLAEAGLLQGRRATTHWALADALQTRYPHVMVCGDEVLTEQDGVICSGAMTSYLNLALQLVERFAGAAFAAAVGKLMLIDSKRISQASYRSLTVQAQQPHGDPLVTKAQTMLEKRLKIGIRLGDLAESLAVSERTLSRRFQQALGQTPIAYLQTLRIDYAKRLLETSRLSVEAVGEKVGYGDLSTFRRLFKRETGLTPKDFQKRFSRRKPA